MNLTEADTRAKLIDPGLHRRGWTEDLIKREETEGSINASIVDPKEIIKEATIKSASSIILVHNHPSGDAKPSDEDIKITNSIINACKLFDIKVLDHIIVGKNREDYYSFANRGLIR